MAILAGMRRDRETFCDSGEDKKRTFTLESFCKWTQTQAIPLKRYRSHFVPSDLRKFAEQWGDVVG
jgi:hypothetical protein